MFCTKKKKIMMGPGKFRGMSVTFYTCSPEFQVSGCGKVVVAYSLLVVLSSFATVHKRMCLKFAPAVCVMEGKCTCLYFSNQKRTFSKLKFKEKGYICDVDNSARMFLTLFINRDLLNGRNLQGAF